MRIKKVNSSFLLFAISTIILLVFFVLNTSTIKSQSTDIIYTQSSIVDGDLIKTSDNPDIYIVKINNNLRYKRVILNPTIFDSYGHLEWSNVKTVSQNTLNSFVTSQLVREVNADGSIVNGRVYMLFANGDTGIKRHVQLTQSEFLEAGGTDSSIYSINSTEASDTFYITGFSITTTQQLRGFLSNSSGPTITIPTTPPPPLVIPQEPIVPPPFIAPTEPIIPPPSVVPTEEDDDTETAPRPSNGGGSGNRGSGNSGSGNNGSDNTIRASLSFTKGTLQPTTILPGSKKEVLTINVLVSNRPVTIRSMKVALSPTTGTDTSIENTFNKIQLIVDGSVVSTKNIESTQDYEKVLNTAVITLNNLAIDIEEDSTKSIQIHLSTNTTIQESLLKDWNIIINKDSISAIDDDNNTYSNNNPITISTSVRRTNIPTTRPPSTVRNFTASNITTTSLTLSWDEYTNAEDYEVDYCEGSSCTNYSNSELTTGLTRQIDSLTQGTVYKFRIRAALPNNRYSSYRTILQGTSLNAPTLSVSNSQATLTSISLLWTPVTNADGYVIEQCKRESKTTECTDYTISKTITNQETTTTNIQSLTSSSLYQFRIKSVGNHPKVDSSFSDFSEAYTKFLPPTNLRVTSTTSDTINILWNASPMSDGYTVQHCTSPTSCTEKGISGSTTTSEQIAGLTPNTAYTLSIRTESSTAGNSAYSSTISSRTTLSSPDNIRSTASTITSLTVAWNASSGADGYILQACEGETCTNFTTIYTGALLTYQYTNLTQGSTYKFRAKSTGTSPKINSDWSDPVQLTGELSVPTNFRATTQTNSSITLSWNASTGATGYTIAYCRISGCTPNESNPITSTTHSKKVTSLNANNLYRFKIKATHTNSTFDSDYSSIFDARTTLSTPSNFRKTAQTSSSITLGWNRINNTSGYLIDYCRGSSCTLNETTTTTALSTETSKTISSLSSNSIYKFRIKAQANTPSLPSAYSSSIEARTALAAPSGFSVATQKATSIDLSWSALSGATGYTIQYCSGSSSCTPTTTTTSAGVNKSITGLTVNTIYRFRIKATGGAGVIESEYSAILDTRTTLETPTNFSTTDISIYSVALAWDAVTGATGYSIEYCLRASPSTCTSTAPTTVTSTGTSETITGLELDSRYLLKIKATGAGSAVDSPYSGIIGAATLDKLPKPKNLSVTSRTATSMTLGWDKVLDATGYTVQYCDGGSCTPDETSDVTGGSTVTTTISSLTAGTAYKVRIKATHTTSSYNSDYSDILDVVPSLTTPANFSIAIRSVTSMRLEWDAVTGATGYTIQYCEDIGCTPSTTITATGTTKDVTGLSDGTEYRFKIKATASGTTDSSYSAVIGATTLDILPTPTGLSVTSRTATTLTLGWTAVFEASGYTIQHCTGSTSCTPSTSVDVTGGTTTSKTITGLTANTAYRVRIKAEHSSSVYDGRYSSIVDTRTTLATPTNFEVTDASVSSIALGWDAVTGATGYTIESCFKTGSATCPQTPAPKIVTSTGTSEVITGLEVGASYRFRIKATGASPAVESPYSSILLGGTIDKLPTPKNFSATSQTATSITFGWDKVLDATGYTIQHCTGSATCTPSTDVAVTGGSTVTETISGLTLNTIYRARIRAKYSPSSLYDSDFSDIIDARTSLSTPSNLSATIASVTIVRLGWDAVTGATGYTIQHCEGATCTNFANDVTATGTTKDITGLGDGTTYRFKIKATATGIESSYSAPINANTIDALPIPTGLSVTSRTATSITLGWTKVFEASGYTIQHCTGSASCTPSTDVEVTGGDTVTETISSLTANSIYRVRIKAKHSDSGLNSSYSSIVDTRTTLATPTNFSATDTSIHSIVLGWDAVTGATGYSIRYCASASNCTGGPYRTVTSTTTSATATGLEEGASYKFQIKATGANPAVDSPYTAEVSNDTTDKLPTPKNLSVTSRTATSITLGWNKVLDAGGYTIEYCDGGTCTPDETAGITGGNLLSTEFSGLTANTTYRFRIRATHATLSFYSDYSDILDVVPSLTVPANFGAAITSVTIVRLGWDAVVGATGYTIQYCDGASCTDFADDTTATGTTKDITGLSKNTTYQFKIKATASGATDSSYSAAVSATTLSKLPAPTNFRVTSAGVENIIVGWNSVFEASGYTVRYCSGSTSCTSYFAASGISKSATSHNLNPLTANTIYRVGIRATHLDNAARSDYTDSVNTRTTLAVPTNFSVTDASVSSIAFGWDAVTGATGYSIRYCESSTNCTGGPYTTVTSTTTSATATRLLIDSDYRFQIKATGASPAVESPYTSELGSGTTTKLPKPKNFSVTSQTATSITFGWDKVLEATGYTIQHCTGSATCTPSTDVEVTSGDTITETISSLTANTVYRARIRATYSSFPAYNSNYSDTIDARTTLSTPTGLTFIPSQATSFGISLSYSAVTGATGYTVNFCDGAGCTPDTEVDFATYETGFSIVGELTANTIYRFQVKAKGGGAVLDSAYSGIIDARTTLATPANFGIVKSFNNGFSLEWDTVTDATGYTVNLCDGDACAPDTEIDYTTVEAKTISSLDANTIYRLQIKAKGGGSVLDSPYSDIIDARTTLAVPTNLSSTAQTGTTITLAWTAVTGASGYKIDYCSGSSCTPDESTTPVTVTSGTTTSKAVTGLTANTTYKFRIKATATSPAVASAYTAPITQATESTTLPAPTNFRATRTGVTSIEFQWLPVSGSNGYKIDYCDGATCTEFDESETSTSIVKIITGLTANTAYRFKIKATHATSTNDSPYTDIVSSSTRQKLATPSIGSVTGSDQTSIQLGWSKILDATGYEIQHCEGTSCTPSTTTSVTGGDATYKSIESLTEATTYTVRMRAIHTTTSYNSDWSTTKTGSTHFRAPANFAAPSANITSNSITMRWDAVPNATSYVIRSCQGASCSNFAQIGTTSATNYTATGLSSSTTYKFRVEATKGSIRGLQPTVTATTSA